MTNRIFKNFISIFSGLIFAAAIALSVPAQYPPGVKARLAGSLEQTLSGVIRVNKQYGLIPYAAGFKVAASNPCEEFYVAALDPDNKNRIITANRANLDHGRDDGEFFICKYRITVPANKSLYVIAGMGSTTRLPAQTRDPYYITDAWIGGTNNKPPRGYERGFAGHFVTLGTVKAMYLKFDLYYARVDPN